MNLFFRKLHLSYYFFLVGLVFYLLYPFFYFSSRSAKRYALLNKFRRVWSISTLFLAGIRYKVSWEEPIDKNGTYVFCPNHSSYLDTPLMCLVASGPYHFMGKDDLLKNPVLKLFFQTIDVPVNRESKIASFRAFRRVTDNIGKGMSLILFPEGKIPDEAPELGEFKNGAFKMAIEKQVPVVPVTFLNNWHYLLDNGKVSGLKPGTCDIFVHKAIPTTGLVDADADRLKQQVFDIINTKLKAYRSAGLN